MEIKGISMFSGGGVGEVYLQDLNINITLANEKIERRANFYKYIHPKTKMIVGDINNDDIFNEYIKNISDEHKILIATPPCQGVSLLGKNKSKVEMIEDERNYLIYRVFDVIDRFSFDYIVIENVVRYLDLFIPYKGKLLNIVDIIKKKYSESYNIYIEKLNAKYYGVPQSRPRSFIILTKKGLQWREPRKEEIKTLRDVIGNLPSLESGENSNIKHHNARKHIDSHIIAMKHTKTGCSAMDNEVYYPKTKSGKKVKGFSSTYKRMDWDKPAPAVTMRNDAISSQENVHPGRLREDGTYSDARVLTLRELFIVSSLPADWNIPEWASEALVRQIVGEGVPPLFMYKVIEGLIK